MKRILSLLQVPTELLAWHLYFTSLLVSVALIHTNESVLIEIILQFSYDVKVSTAGLKASTVQFKFANIPAETTGTVDMFALKEAFSGAPVPKKKNPQSHLLRFFAKFTNKICTRN